MRRLSKPQRKLRMFARMGRLSYVTREELLVQLAPLGSAAEVRKAVDEAFSIPEKSLREMGRSLAQAILSAAPAARIGKGRSPDSRGFDDEDRAIDAVALASLGLNGDEN